METDPIKSGVEGGVVCSGKSGIRSARQGAAGIDEKINRVVQGTESQAIHQQGCSGRNRRTAENRAIGLPGNIESIIGSIEWLAQKQLLRATIEKRKPGILGSRCCRVGSQHPHIDDPAIRADR